MESVRLRLLLERLADMVGAMVPAAQAQRDHQEIKSLAAAIDAEGRPCAEDALAGIEERLAADPVEMSPDALVAQLDALQGDQLKFDALMSVLTQKGISKSLLVAVAKGYAKGTKYASKQAALDAVRARFRERRRAIEEERYLKQNNVTPW